MSTSRPFLLATLFLGTLTGAARPVDVTVVDRPPVAPANNHYVSNRPPLKPSGLIRLPPGSVRPDGWLRTMLRLQADGFHGRLQELSKFLRKENNSWLSRDGRGDHGWEEVPYWLKGYLNCGYALNDERIIKDAQLWIDGAINSQQKDGWFGPGDGRTGVATDLVGRTDLWPNMVMLFCLQDYYEKTADPRVLDLMKRYFRYLEAVPEEKFLVGYWPSMRGGDQLTSILWLYNRTAEKWLLDLAVRTHRKTARWDTGLINLHNVNVAQAFREPATFWVLSGKDADLAATEKVWQTVRARFGRVPGGMFGADENARDGYTGPRQAIETCGMVEEMLSDELLIAITGDPVWAERCEDVAFNSLPAAFTADMKALRYLTSPNMPQSDHASKAPGLQNGGDMCGMNPHTHRCCQHNAGHGWPYFAHHLWYATAGNGLAAYLYAPSTVTATVGEGMPVTITTKTKYPFVEKIEFAVAPLMPVKFPLYLRIPASCSDVGLAINGRPADVPLIPSKVARIDREWKAGDVVTMTLKMRLVVRTWAENRNTISVSNGPLTYSLLIRERYKRYAGTDTWPAHDILPASVWNYGLEFDPAKPLDCFTLKTSPWPADDRPFTEACPVWMTAKARPIPNWKLDNRGLVREVAAGPVKSTEPVETVTLIPMGAARLRISAFPRIDNAAGKDWPPPPEPKFVASASHCWENDTPDAACDDVLPKHSNDQTIERFTWWPRKGRTEWLQYEFKKPLSVSGAGVYWFDDTPRGGCKLPKGWRLLYREGAEWKPVPGVTDYPVAKDMFCDVTFAPVTTTALRLEAELEKDFSAGVLEWRLTTADPK